MVNGVVTQERIVTGGKFPGSYDPYRIIPLPGWSVQSGLADFRTRQKTVSYRTNVPDALVPSTGREQLAFLMGDKNTLSREDKGHEFETIQETQIPQRDQSVYMGDLFFTGPVYCYNANPNILGGASLPDEPSFNLDYYGNRLVVAASPTLPMANLSQSFAELAREGFSSVAGWTLLSSLGTKSDFFRSLGSEYLNLQFGWIPFLKDLRQVIESVSKANLALLQLQNREGLLTRRQRGIPDQITTRSATSNDGVLSVGGNWDIASNSAWNPSGRRSVTITHTTIQRIWFVGSFTYKLRAETDLLSRIARYEQLAQYLLGTRITPSVLWELAPWSWLIDWVVDIQSALRRAELTTQDGNVMKYGYLMRQTTQRAQYAMSFTFSNGYTQHYSSTYLRKAKRRYRATPFGFGVNPESFTPSQLAIIAALGLSRGPHD